MIRWLGVMVIVLAALAPSAFGQTLANGSFATGDLTGWTSFTVDGGQVSVVKQGVSFSSVPGSDLIPFPTGPGGYAANLRADKSINSVAILTSAPFVPKTESVVFFTLSEKSTVAPKVLVLNPDADLLSPSVQDTLWVTGVTRTGAGTGADARFQRQQIDVSDEFAAKKAIRIQFRQPHTPTGTGFFTLISAIDDTGQPADTLPPSPITDLTANDPAPTALTLSFTAPQDPGVGSGGSAASYDVRYSLLPIDETNFASATQFTSPPAPLAAGMTQSFAVTGLEPLQNYYFALKSFDAGHHLSSISNVINAATTAPASIPGGPGLTAQYYHIGASETLPPDRSILFAPSRLIEGATRIEPTVDIDYSMSRPSVVPPERFGVRYTGQLLLKTDGSYTFCTRSDDGSRLWISKNEIDPTIDPPLVSKWTQGNGSESCSEQRISLHAGLKYNLLLEYVQGLGDAENHLLWSSPSGPKEVVPADLLSTTAPPIHPVGRVTGTLLDTSEAPVPGFTLHLTSQSGMDMSVVTDDAGVFSALLTPGEYRISGEDLTHSIPPETPPATVVADQRITLLPIHLSLPAAKGLGIANGNFATGDLTGWTATGINDGYVLLVKHGQEFPGNNPSDPIPFPGGDEGWAVDVRSSNAGTVDSMGILISDVFIPNAPTLTFRTLSQNLHIVSQILLVKPSADPIDPKPEDILLMADVVNEHPGQDGHAIFESQSIDISSFYNAAQPSQGTPMRLVARQHTTDQGAGWFTLFTNFDAGPHAPLPLLKGDLNYDGHVDVADAILTLRIVVGTLDPVPPELLPLADVAPKNADNTYGDGEVTVGDAVRILRRAVGLETDPWP